MQSSHCPVKILSRPSSLVLLSFALIVFPLFSIFQLGQLLPMPWSEPFSLQNPIWLKWFIALAVQGGIWIFIIQGILSVRVLALYTFGIVVFGSSLLLGFLSILHRSPQLALICFAVFLAGIIFLYLLKKEYSRSFYKHGRSWFQSRPDVIPHLTARIALNGGAGFHDLSEAVHIGNLSIDGFFGFIEASHLPESRVFRGVIELDGKPVPFEGRLCSELGAEKIAPWIGFGVQFRHDPEHNMRIGDLIESLRSRGYVQQN